MISLAHVSKEYPTHSGRALVLDDVSFSVMPSQKVGILGRNGAGKSTLIRIISGAERPSSGAITRNMSVSWPLAFGGAFQASLTGLDNIRFICRIYGQSPKDAEAYVQEFSELGRYLREPVKTYSSGMRARLAFAISMLIEFDCFLIDEIMAVGDVRFQRKCHDELFVKRADRAMIIVSHDESYIRSHCSEAYILHEGRIIRGGNLDDTISIYNSLMQ
ncbi:MULTISPECIES: ABC transporter ATP-binding protein [unclassified Sphingobium]|uniref:ABC transporter ATP-binding protein n=1 Tax=unclassified Sphingobium TaxID=2611147 RepID=UPI000971551E|nr:MULTISPECIES: ABC transporter ATP-binding protein [unclassified Sphingobium]